MNRVRERYAKIPPIYRGIIAAVGFTPACFILFTIMLAFLLPDRSWRAPIIYGSLIATPFLLLIIMKTKWGKRRARLLLGAIIGYTALVMICLIAIIITFQQVIFE